MGLFPDCTHTNNSVQMWTLAQKQFEQGNY